MPTTGEKICLPRFFSQTVKPQLFEGLSEVALESLLEKSILQDHPAQCRLVEQGDEPDCIYLVISGTVRTMRTDAEGNEVVIRMLQAGDTCMEAVLFMGGPSPITVEVVEGAQLLRIPDSAVKALARQESRFSWNLLRIVTRHYKNAIHQIDSMGIKTPLQRVGYYLLLKHLEKGCDELNFELPFKKSMIASYLGMTPETFSRTLKQLRDFGIRVDGKKVRLNHSFSLCDFCDPDAASLCGRKDRPDCPQSPVFIRNYGSRG